MTVKNEKDFYKKLIQHSQDKYSSENMQFDPNLYKKIVRSDSRFAPDTHMKKLSQYIDKIKTLQSFQLEKSTRAHIDAPSGTWYTHRSPLGCFMCEDQQFISVLISILEYLSHTYPKLPLDPHY